MAYSIFDIINAKKYIAEFEKKSEEKRKSIKQMTQVQATQDTLFKEFSDLETNSSQYKKSKEILELFKDVKDVHGIENEKLYIMKYLKAVTMNEIMEK